MQTDPDFFTPPRLPPLNLDVASLGGGGSAPAQFSGQMTDGRRVFCRYRGGQLSIDVALKPGVEAYIEGNTLLDAHIGPLLHGGISLGQLCRYAGITIAGQLPPMPTKSEIEKECFLDLSGDTTFLDLWAHSTEATARRIYDEILEQLPGIIGAQRLQPSQRNYSICRSSAEATGWQLNLLRPLASRLTTEHGWPIEVVDVEGVGSRMAFGFIRHGAYRSTAWGMYSYQGLPVDDLGLQLSFPASDGQGRRLATLAHRIVNEHCPVTRIIALDLSTHERIPEKDQQRSLDRKIPEWVKDNGHQWLFVGGDLVDGASRQIGYRPEGW